MVSTRGHRDNDEPKSNLPPRECRKPRTTLQEPEDEMFWESDDTVNHMKRKTRSGVTFEEEKSFHHSSAERSSSRLLKEEDMIGVEADTDTDDELFRHRRTSRSSVGLRNRREGRRAAHCSPITKEFVMNGDDEMSDKSDHEIGLRRSSRQKKSLGYSQSWLFGDKKLRGYPNMIHSSEPENDELRPARKAKRYVHSSSNSATTSLPQRRSLRFRKKSPEQRGLARNRDYLLHKHSSRQLSRRSRRLPLRYRDSHSEDDDDMEEEEEELEEEQERDDRREEEEDKEKERASRRKDGLRSRPLPRRGRRKTNVKLEGYSRDETENSEEEERHMERAMRKRVRPQRGFNCSKREPSSESDDKEEQDSKQSLNQESEMNGASPKEKTTVIEKPKRERKPVARLTYPPVMRRSRKVSSSDENDDAGDEDDEEEEEEEEDEVPEKKESSVRGRYSLRQNRKTLMESSFETLEPTGSRRRRKHGEKPKTLKDFLSSPARKQKVFNKKYRATHNSELSSTGTSSDEKEFEKRYSKSMAKARNRCLPMNFSPDDHLHANVKERSKIGSSLADIDPMHVDTSVTFDCVGGLSQHVKSLKEMIIFPLLYPEVFQKFSVTPPRGVLFYGPPGTGKTLVARALASECSQKDRKVAFFMRKGADCLSKWVGESERQLRLLFDQAYQMRPSIIFFDEIDGLAPVRSTRQDQIHSSIVSTLLALMDGLDSRGEVVVIGATNRIDAIDPALRRPGRFDREFNFPLPTAKARKQIIDIHTSKWTPKPSKRLVQYLSEQTVGFCGADLKALCAEAMLNALRSRYPQIYTSKDKLLLDVSKIHIKIFHFRQALSKIVPAGQRASSTPGRKLNKVIEPLLQSAFSSTLRNLRQSFPQGFNKLVLDRVVHRPRLLLSGLKGQGQTTHLAPAILHTLENIPTHKLDLPSLFSVSARAPEEACAQVFLEARRNLPSIIYIPLMDQWWSTVSETVQSTFLSLLNDFDPTTPLLLLATSNTPYNQMDEKVQKLFSSYREEMIVMTNPKEDTRRVFFRPIFFTKMTQKPKVIQRKKRVFESLPLAPPPQPRKLTAPELHKIEEVEEATLRELRIFLRQICAKLAKNRMFFIFTKPVDLDEVPDYLEVISTPMDLETMMTKIDHHQYQCAEDFLKHIDLICSNALEYNPDRNPEDKLIRHRACTLRDTAYAYIKAEMDTDFEMKCRDIRKARIYRKQSASELAPDFIKMAADALAEKNSKSNSGSSTPLTQNSQQTDLSLKSKGIVELNRKRKRRRSSWARGLLSSAPKKKKSSEKEEGKKDEGETKEDNNEAEAKNGGKSDLDVEEELSLNSSIRADEENETCGEQSTDNSPSKVLIESALCNGNLSTEDSRDSMKVTSAADLLYNKSLQECIQKEKLNNTSESHLPPHLEADESVVSSSEPGCSNDRCMEVLIDWAHLEAVYDSCIAVTEGATVDELHHLYTLLLALSQKYAPSIDRAPLLTEVELELRRFAQFRDKP